MKRKTINFDLAAHNKKKVRDFDADDTRLTGIAEKKRLIASGVAEAKVGKWRGKTCWIFYVRGAPRVRLSQSDLERLCINMQTNE